MKTININLIGTETKVIKTNKIAVDINEKTKTISIMAVTGACIVFVICAGVWFTFFYSAKKTSSELSGLKLEHEKLKAELAASTTNFKNLQQEKRILKLKQVVQNQVNDTLLPWYKILCDVSYTVPKNIKITKISKSSSSKDSKATINLGIDGEVDIIQAKDNPLQVISYFVLNINENSSLDSYLSDAVIKSADYNEKSRSYNFTINTAVNLPEKKQEK